jgi:hypothetical protein
MKPAMPMRKKLCLLLTSDADDIPFDLKHHRHVVYGKSIQNLRMRLEEELTWIQAEVYNRQSVLVIGLVLASPVLDKCDFHAQGVVDLVFDLHNKTGSTSPELEAMYFYTGQGWTYKQDGNECPSTSSDESGFNTRHFIKPPVRRLSAGTWAQVKITGTKLIAWKSKENPLKDKYRLAGRSMIRAITSDGAFDFPIPLDLTFEEFPF